MGKDGKGAFEDLEVLKLLRYEYVITYIWYGNYKSPGRPTE